uniref:SH2 domain-containing protein n=1 Tax=Nothoprocta perdicaria TaxID=30464 RepID=A0A8C6ZJH6_NOTPE
MPTYPCPHFQSTPFDNFLHPPGPRPILGTEEQAGEEAKMRKLKRGATLRWFRETQAQKVMQDDGAFPSWLHGMISRREAENLLIDKPLGCFLVRISQSRPGYTLTYRGEGRCRHYMIEMQPNARYVILGEDRAHASLTQLVRYHQTVGIQPFMETLSVPCGQVSAQHVQQPEGLLWALPWAQSLGSVPAFRPRCGMHPFRPQQSSASLDYEDLEGLSLAAPAAEEQAPRRGQSCPPGPPAGKPPLQTGAASVLKRVWFRRTKRGQEQQSPDESGARASAGEEGGGQRAFPRLHSSIRLAMQEIQQVSRERLPLSSAFLCHSLAPRPLWHW